MSSGKEVIRISNSTSGGRLLLLVAAALLLLAAFGVHLGQLDSVNVAELGGAVGAVGLAL